MSRTSCQAAVQHMSHYFHSGLCTKLLRVAILNCNSLGFGSQAVASFFSFSPLTQPVTISQLLVSLLAGTFLQVHVSPPHSTRSEWCVLQDPPPQPPASSQTPPIPIYPQTPSPPTPTPHPPPYIHVHVLSDPQPSA